MAKVISIDNIEDGMILQEPVVNNYGQTLIGAGATLSAKHKNTFKTWNILTVIIQSDDTEDEGFAISEELLVSASVRLKERMKWEPRNQFENELFDMGVYQLARQMSRKQ
jgi:hypothetical protein